MINSIKNNKRNPPKCKRNLKSHDHFAFLAYRNKISIYGGGFKSELRGDERFDNGYMDRSIDSECIYSMEIILRSSSDGVYKKGNVSVDNDTTEGMSIDGELKLGEEPRRVYPL